MDQAIAAVATGQRRSAIGVIRLSGEGCIDCAARVFKPASGAPFGSGQAGRLALGTLLDAAGAPLDQAMAVFFRAPHSYTGEDACELHCHGSPTVLTLALEALFAQGVRQAGPGEFTKRAFLNGKLDLLEAEAVADLIDARTPAAARQAAGQLTGALSRQVSAVYDGLLDLLAHFHATVDYPDEDLDPLDAAGVDAALAGAEDALAALLDTYRRGRLVREGVPTAIVGKPNVGKSTLLNALVGYDRSIVTDAPGTTRDTVEECCVLGGLLLRLTDTAGVRDTADPVERLGVERTAAAMETAGLILVLADRSRPLDAGDRDLLARAAALAPTLLVRTKSDLSPAPAETFPGVTSVDLSAQADPQGAASALAGAVAALFPLGTEEPGLLLTNARQAEAAGRALEAVRRARQAQAAGLPPDVVLLDAEEALAALGGLSGQDLREDLANRVFSRFCVGK